MTAPEYDYYYNLDGEATRREVLLDIDASEPGDYLVQRWGYYGFEDVRTFETPEAATAYAVRKSQQKEGRYRVLGPETKE